MALMPFRTVALLERGGSALICVGGSELSVLHWMRFNKLHLKMREAYEVEPDDKIIGLALEAWRYRNESTEHGYWHRVRILANDFVERKGANLRLRKQVERELEMNRR